MGYMRAGVLGGRPGRKGLVRQGYASVPLRGYHGLDWGRVRWLCWPVDHGSLPGHKLRDFTHGESCRRSVERRGRHKVSRRYPRKHSRSCGPTVLRLASRVGLSLKSCSRSKVGRHRRKLRKMNTTSFHRSRQRRIRGVDVQSVGSADGRQHLRRGPFTRGELGARTGYIEGVRRQRSSSLPKRNRRLGSGKAKCVGTGHGGKRRAFGQRRRVEAAGRHGWGREVLGVDDSLTGREETAKARKLALDRDSRVMVAVVDIV